MRVHWGAAESFPDYWEVTAQHRAKRVRDGKVKLFTLRRYILRGYHRKGFYAKAQAKMERALRYEVNQWRLS